MYKVLLVIGILLTSCTVTKKNYLTGKTEILLINEYVIVPPTHIHFEGGGHNNCSYMETWSYNYIDTIELEIIKTHRIINFLKKN